MEIGIGDRVAITNSAECFVIGAIDGMKMNRNGIERISFEGLDHWFWLTDGWQFVVEEEGEDDGEIQPE